MTDSQSLYILKLLHIIHHRLDVNGLLDLGLEYYQIATLISEVLQKELVIEVEGRLILSDLGLKELEGLNKKLYPTNKNNWILPNEENRGPKNDNFDIYLPRKNK